MDIVEGVMVYTVPLKEYVLELPVDVDVVDAVEPVPELEEPEQDPPYPLG